MFTLKKMSRAKRSVGIAIATAGVVLIFLSSFKVSSVFGAILLTVLVFVAVYAFLYFIQE